MYVMMITEMRKGDGMENGSGDSCLSVWNHREKEVIGGEKIMLVMNNERENNNGCSSSSCSSIGRNSDDDKEDEDEVQSKCENGSFDSIQALEEALPMRKGMSRFYNGKSKSFTSLADVSINEIVKPESPYSRRRRNLLAYTIFSDKNRGFKLKGSGGVSKRSINSSRTTLALAVAMSSGREMRRNPDSEPAMTSRLSSDSKRSVISRLSPHYSQLTQTHFNSLPSSPGGNFSTWRSFSFADLEQCASLKASAPL